jgi:hypothetical protein
VAKHFAISEVSTARGSVDTVERPCLALHNTNPSLVLDIPIY